MSGVLPIDGSIAVPAVGPVALPADGPIAQLAAVVLLDDDVSRHRQANAHSFMTLL